MARLIDRPGLVLLELDGLLVTLMHTAPDGETFTALRDAYLEVYRRQQPVSTLTIIPTFGGVPRTDRERQLAYMKVLDDRQRHLATAIVLGVQGAAGALIRLSINSLSLLAPGAPPLRFCADVAEALAWLAGRPGQVALPDASTVLRALAEASAR